jgi:hypothetical protein
VFYGNEYEEYASVHPIKHLLAQQTWNNIPLPVRDLFEMISDYVVEN